MRRIFDGKYTNYGLGCVHPNGTYYGAFQNKVDKYQVEIWQRSPAGEWRQLKVYRDGLNVTGAIGITQCSCLPNGDLLVITNLSQPDGSQDPFEDLILGAAPPFTAGAVYSYPVSANDTVARQASEAAVQAAQRAEQIATQAKVQVKADGAKVEARIAEVQAAAQKAIAGLSVQAVAGAIKAQLNNTSDLAGFIWQKARDASYLHLKELGIIKEPGK